MLLQWLNNIGNSNCIVYYGIIVKECEDKYYLQKGYTHTNYGLDLWKLMHRQLVDVNWKGTRKKPIVVRSKFREYLKNRTSDWIKERDNEQGEAYWYGSEVYEWSTSDMTQ